MPNYKKAQLKGDLSAGLTVGVMLIPQGMAYAMIAGLHGKVVFQSTVYGNAQIDVSSWVGGLYIVKVHQVYLKLVVE